MSIDSRNRRAFLRAMFAEAPPEYGSPEEQEAAEAVARLHAAYRALGEEIGPESATESVPRDDVDDVSSLDIGGLDDDHSAAERNDYTANYRRQTNIADR